MTELPSEPRPDDRALWRRLRSPKPFLNETIAIVFIAGGIVVLESLPVTYEHSALFLSYLGFVIPVAMLALLISAIVHRGARRPPEWSLGREALAIGRIAVVLALTLPIHFLLKSFIHLINSKTWDLQLSRLDQAIHFGISPSRFFTALFPSPMFLHALDVTYSSIYFIVAVGYPAIFLALLPIRRKLAFAAAYEFVWIAGILVYLAFPSWGPVFVFSGDFQSTLASMPITVHVQTGLYQEITSLVRNPLGRRVIRYGCVAAFPSLHVAEVALLTLTSRWISRKWFRWNLGFLAIIVLGSVVTGYHYLIDAEAGLLLTGGAWWAAGRIYRPRRDTSPERSIA